MLQSLKQHRPKFIVLGICVVILIPFLIHVIGSQPVLDDLFFAVCVENGGTCRTVGDYQERPLPAWLNSSGALIRFLAWRYINWSGRYGSDLLVVLWLLLTKGGAFYPFVVYALMASLLGAFYFFYRSISFKRFASVTVATLNFTFFCVLVPNFAEHMMWITSFITYQSAVALGLVAAGLLVRTLKYYQNTSRFYTLHVLLLLSSVFFLVGFNESIPAVLIPFLLLCVVNTHSIPFRKIAACAMGVAIIGFIIVLASPGNAVRINIEQRTFTQSLWFAIISSMGAGLLFSGGFTLLMGLFSSIPLFRRVLKNISSMLPFDVLFNWRRPSLIVAFYLLCPCCFLFVLTWGLGSFGPLRAHGQMILTMLAAWPFIAIRFSKIYCQAKALTNSSTQSSHHNRWHISMRGGLVKYCRLFVNYTRRWIVAYDTSRTLIRTIAIVLALLIIIFGVPPLFIPPTISLEYSLIDQIFDHNLSPLAVVNMVASEYLGGNIRASIADLHLFGSYLHTLRERQLLLNNASDIKHQTVMLPNFIHRPALVYITDITGDADHYYNEIYARYYDVPSVVLLR